MHNNCWSTALQDTSYNKNIQPLFFMLIFLLVLVIGLSLLLGVVMIDAAMHSLFSLARQRTRNVELVMAKCDGSSPTVPGMFEYTRSVFFPVLSRSLSLSLSPPFSLSLCLPLCSL